MTSNPTPLYCANHPTVATSLRCNRCEKPICPKCAVATPTGYRCKECVRGQQKAFDTTLWYDYLVASLVASSLSLIGSRIIPMMSFFTILLSPIAGVIIAEAIRALSRRRRSKRLFQVAAIATALGSLPSLLMIFLPAVLNLSNFSLNLLWPLLWQGFYAVTVTSTVYYRLSGIKLNV
ncbi:MAG: B-box zinc finger protein [Anaerolineales bacterium]|nr:B-box zinc finger protein [Anaerolineales bacterium]